MQRELLPRVPAVARPDPHAPQPHRRGRRTAPAATAPAPSTTRRCSPRPRPSAASARARATTSTSSTPAGRRGCRAACVAARGRVLRGPAGRQRRGRAPRASRGARARSSPARRSRSPSSPPRRSSTAPRSGPRRSGSSAAARWCSQPGPQLRRPQVACQLVEDEKVNTIILVGDAMARPLAEALARAATRTDMCSLMVIASAGAVLSDAVKDAAPGAAAEHDDPQQLRRHRDGAPGDGRLRRGLGRQADVLRWTSSSTVLGDDMRPIAPGSGVDRQARAPRAPPGRLLQRPREDGGDLPHHRRRALGHPRRLRHGR